MKGRNGRAGRKGGERNEEWNGGWERGREELNDDGEMEENKGTTVNGKGLEKI